jgi:hypothetical protein
MNNFIKYVEPIWLDDTGQVSGKRILAIISILSGVILTFLTNIIYLYFVHNNFDKAKNIDLAQITMLIAPLFGNGLLLWGVTSYFQNKKDELNQ